MQNELNFSICFYFNNFAKVFTIAFTTKLQKFRKMIYLLHEKYMCLYYKQILLKFIISIDIYAL